MAKKDTGNGKSGIALVKMFRTEESAAGGPITADVHPDEVENFKSGGWQVKTPPVLYKETEALELIAAAQSVAEVDEIIEGDPRATVLKAAADRKALLTEEAGN